MTTACTTSRHVSNVGMHIYLFTTDQGYWLQRLDRSMCSLHEFVSSWIIDKQSLDLTYLVSNHMPFHFYKTLGSGDTDLTIKPADGKGNIMHPELVREPPCGQLSLCIWLLLTHILWLSLKSLVNRINKQVRINKNVPQFKWKPLANIHVSKIFIRLRLHDVI